MKQFYAFFLSICFAFSAFGQYDNATIRSLADADLEPFYHGVASGDPTSSSVILWTRVTPEVDGPIDVSWIISTNRDFSDTTSFGVFTTNA